MFVVLSWTIKETELSINRSKFAVAKTAFSQIVGRRNKTDFVIGLIDGFASQVFPIYREMLAQNVSNYKKTISKNLNVNII